MSNNSKSFEKSSIAEYHSGANAESPHTPYDETAEKHPALDSSRGSLWKPLYIVSFLAMVAGFVLVGVSLAVDMFYVEVVPPSYIRTTAFSAVCTGGCAAADQVVADALFTPDPSYARPTTTSEVFAQMQPFAVTSCVERSTGVYAISAGSSTSKARGTFEVDCSVSFVTTQYTDFKYAEGFTFYHAVGAPRIHRMDYLVEQQTVPVVAILFVFSGLSLVLYAAVIALRATVSGKDAAHARERRCACNAPNHVRRLTAAVISFLVCSVIMAIVQLILCGIGQAPSDRCERCKEDIKVTGGYWAIFAIILAVHVIALILVCACYAMRA